MRAWLKRMRAAKRERQIMRAIQLMALDELERQGEADCD